MEAEWDGHLTDVFVWGSRCHGESGIPPAAPDRLLSMASRRTKPTLVSTVQGFRFRSLALGDNRTLAVTAEGDVLAWGRRMGCFTDRCDDVSRLRMVPWTEVSFSPEIVPVAARVVSVSCAYHHALLLADDGSLFAFGVNLYGQLGTGDQVSQPRPARVALPPDAVGQVAAVATGRHHSVALLRGGHVLTWGRTSQGALGFHPPEGVTAAPEPRRVALAADVGGRRVTAVAAGEAHTAMLTSDESGFLVCGTLGRDCVLWEPVRVCDRAAQLGKLSGLCAGRFFTAFLSSECPGEVLLWPPAEGGSGAGDELGAGGLGPLRPENCQARRPQPVVVHGGVRYIAAGFNGLCAIGNDGTVLEMTTRPELRTAPPPWRCDLRPVAGFPPWAEGEINALAVGVSHAAAYNAVTSGGNRAPPGVEGRADREEAGNGAPTAPWMYHDLEGPGGVPLHRVVLATRLGSFRPERYRGLLVPTETCTPAPRPVSLRLGDGSRLWELQQRQHQQQQQQHQHQQRLEDESKHDDDDELGVDLELGEPMEAGGLSLRRRLVWSFSSLSSLSASSSSASALFWPSRKKKERTQQQGQRVAADGSSGVCWDNDETTSAAAVAAVAAAAEDPADEHECREVEQLLPALTEFCYTGRVDGCSRSEDVALLTDFARKHGVPGLLRVVQDGKPEGGRVGLSAGAGPPPPPAFLGGLLARALVEPASWSGADVLVVAGPVESEWVSHAHRSVLARRSSYFGAAVGYRPDQRRPRHGQSHHDSQQQDHEQQEQQQQQDLQVFLRHLPGEAVRACVWWMYSGWLVAPAEGGPQALDCAYVASVLLAADEVALEDLKSHCEVLLYRALQPGARLVAEEAPAGFAAVSVVAVRIPGELPLAGDGVPELCWGFKRNFGAGRPVRRPGDSSGRGPPDAAGSDLASAAPAGGVGLGEWVNFALRYSAPRLRTLLCAGPLATSADPRDAQAGLESALAVVEGAAQSCKELRAIHLLDSQAAEYVISEQEFEAIESPYRAGVLLRVAHSLLSFVGLLLLALRLAGRAGVTWVLPVSVLCLAWACWLATQAAFDVHRARRTVRWWREQLRRAKREQLGEAASTLQARLSDVREATACGLLQHENVGVLSDAWVELHGVQYELHSSSEPSSTFSVPLTRLAYYAVLLLNAAVVAAVAVPIALFLDGSPHSAWANPHHYFVWFPLLHLNALLVVPMLWDLWERLRFFVPAVVRHLRPRRDVCHRLLYVPVSILAVLEVAGTVPGMFLLQSTLIMAKILGWTGASWVAVAMPLLVRVGVVVVSSVLQNLCLAGVLLYATVVPAMRQRLRLQWHRMSRYERERRVLWSFTQIMVIPAFVAVLLLVLRLQNVYLSSWTSIYGAALAFQAVQAVSVYIDHRLAVGMWHKYVHAWRPQ